MFNSRIFSPTTTRLLAEADAKAEQTLAIVRMVVAGSIFIALSIALNLPQRPASEFLEKQEFFASIGMASYFLVGLAAFLVVRFGLYRPWMAWVTAFFDVVLISSNVWLSVYYSGLSTLYALIFPSALMVPLVLVFGALRFRPDIQLFTTVFACGLACVVILSNPFFPMSDETILTQMEITHGLPPNMIRVWLIFATGIVVTIAVWRARSLLHRVSEQTEQRMNLVRFLPKTLGDALDDNAISELRRGKKLVVSMLFMDVRGFTKMAEGMTDEATSAFLTELRGHVIDVAETHGGIVDKFIGDGALVVFGSDGDAEAGARACASAAIVFSARIADWNRALEAEGLPRFEVGLGLHTGPVLLGAIGDDRRLEFTVIGDEVNVGSRVEQMTKQLPYEILATENVMQHLGAENLPKWQALGDQSVVGHSGTVSLYGYTPDHST